MQFFLRMRVQLVKGKRQLVNPSVLLEKGNKPVHSKSQ